MEPHEERARASRRAPGPSAVAVVSGSVSRTRCAQRRGVVARRHGALDVGHDPVAEDVPDQRIQPPVVVCGGARGGRAGPCCVQRPAYPAEVGLHEGPPFGHEAGHAPAQQVRQPIYGLVRQVLQQPHHARTSDRPATRCHRVVGATSVVIRACGRTVTPGQHRPACAGRAVPVPDASASVAGHIGLNVCHCSGAARTNDSSASAMAWVAMTTERGDPSGTSMAGAAVAR